MGLFTAVTFRALLGEAKSSGIDLNSISDEDIVRLCPTTSTITHAIQYGQQVDDVRNRRDFKNAVAVYAITDAGNKKR